MSTITIQDLSDMTTLDTQAMNDTRGGRMNHIAKRKLKLLPRRRYYLRPVQSNNVNFGSGNSFVGNTAGVNNGSMTINGGIHL